ncbi:MAG: transposase [Thermodesulfobacteriota bacterium]
MPRANRYFIPGYVWHITHRCHQKEFLFRFGRDRQVWIRWLFEAKKRYDLEVLNFTVTSNHIHLLVYGGENRETIPRAMQLVAGRTAQELNRRTQRKGAFWEDRYHATAIDADGYLARCFVYIDLNMVRAGVVQHPREWSSGGFNEILNPPARYRLLARNRLKELLSIDEDSVASVYSGWIEEALQAEAYRQPAWSESVAVGSNKFVAGIKEELGVKAIGRKIHESPHDRMNSLREPGASYTSDFDMENAALSNENSLFWNIFP